MCRARWLLVMLGCALVAGTWCLVGGRAAASAPGSDMRLGRSEAAPGPDGRVLYLRSCAMCHGAAGVGTANGPSLRAVGTASVDFMVRTGRMPLSSPDARVERHEPKFTSAQVRALVAYASTFTHGPEVPRVRTDDADLGAGATRYQQACAACHQSAGAGGALANGDAAPSLHRSSSVDVAEAVRTGPGEMPTFSPSALSDRDVANIAAYVQYLHHPDDRGGINLGHLGPVPEGFIAWTLGLGVLVLACGRIGVRAADRARRGDTDG
ncbi:MAG TPA: cytochrome c [Acidimicrobiales bacterium]|nr:cytochrome c [Acidimicrobiales bacterium]